MTINPESFISILIILILTLFTVLLFHVGRHSRSNFYLGIYFISQIVVLFNLSFHFFSLFLYCLLQSIIFSWGAFYYLFVSSLLNPGLKFKSVHLWHFASIPIGAFLLLINLYPPVKSIFQEKTPLLFGYIKLALNLLFNVLIISYNIATVIKYYKYKTNIRIGPQLKSPVQAVWINLSIWGFVVSCFFSQLGNYLNRIMPNEVFNWSLLGLLAFLIYFCILFYVAIASRTLTEKFEIKEKYKKSNLGETEAILLLSKLDDFMNEHKPFTNPDLKLKEMSDLLKASERNISQIVNTLKKQNFSDYVNSFRVKHAMKLLIDPSFKEKTILWILFEAGFNSKTSFNTTFKKVAGCTPAEYRKRDSSQK